MSFIDWQIKVIHNRSLLLKLKHGWWEKEWYFVNYVSIALIKKKIQLRGWMIQEKDTK